MDGFCTFGKYLECGIFAYGFARARCADCAHDYFVAFFCKVFPLDRRMLSSLTSRGIDYFVPIPQRQPCMGH